MAAPIRNTPTVKEAKESEASREIAESGPMVVRSVAEVRVKAHAILIINNNIIIIVIIIVIIII